jgi:hypothetical protein
MKPVHPSVLEPYMPDKIKPVDLTQITKGQQIIYFVGTQEFMTNTIIRNIFENARKFYDSGSVNLMQRKIGEYGSFGVFEYIAEGK